MIRLHYLSFYGSVYVLKAWEKRVKLLQNIQALLHFTDLWFTLKNLTRPPCLICTRPISFRPPRPLRHTDGFTLCGSAHSFSGSVLLQLNWEILVNRNIQSIYQHLFIWSNVSSNPLEYQSKMSDPTNQPGQISPSQGLNDGHSATSKDSKFSGKVI